MSEPEPATERRTGRRWRRAALVIGLANSSALFFAATPEVLAKAEATTQRSSTPRTTRKATPTTRIAQQPVAASVPGRHTTTVAAPAPFVLLLHPFVARDLDHEPICRSLVRWLGARTSGEVTVLRGSAEACVAFVDSTRTEPSPMSRAPKFDVELRFVAVPQAPFTEGSKWQSPGANTGERGFVELRGDLHPTSAPALWASSDGNVLLRQFDDGTLLRVQGTAHVVQRIRSMLARGPMETVP